MLFYTVIAELFQNGITHIFLSLFRYYAQDLLSEIMSHYCQKVISQHDGKPYDGGENVVICAFVTNPVQANWIKLLYCLPQR